MPGLNTTGKPDTRDYVVGGGKVLLARLDANGMPQEYRHLGNCPSFKSNVTATILEHVSSLTGLKYVDEQVVVQQKTALSLELDEINFDNLALFLSGDAETYDNSVAAAGVTADATNGNLIVYAKGRHYNLYKATTGAPAVNPADSRIYDIGAVTVKSLDAMTTYTLGTDYEIDRAQGIIFITAGSTMTANPTTGVKYRVDIAANAPADQAPSQVQGVTKSVIAGSLKFIMINPANSNQQIEFEFWKVQLTAEGDFEMITAQAYTKLTFKGDAQANTAASPNSPVVTVRLQKHAHD